MPTSSTSAYSKVLVTGATGFVGAAVVRHLLEAERQVAVLIRPGSNKWRLAGLLDRVTIIEGNISALGRSDDALTRFGADAVVHLAWNLVKGADRNNTDQINNVYAAVDLYQLARSWGCRRFVGMGSQAEYGAAANRISERTPARPQTLYGASKLAAYLLLERLAENDGVPLAWLRLFSSYGPRDDESWMIPYLTLRLLAREKPSLTGCEQMWDYIYIDDVAAAVASILDTDAVGAFNLGSGQAIRLSEIVTTLRDLIDPSLPLGIGDLPYRHDQVMHLEADISALTAATGWKPRMELKNGLQNTVEWFRSCKAKRD